MWACAPRNTVLAAKSRDAVQRVLMKKYNETDLKYLIEIINYRYQNDLKTIITSERVLDELLDIDEATFGRAVEKCEGYLMNIPKDRNRNYRLRSVTV